MVINADLHIHSRFSGATSQKMRIKKIAKESKKKGIRLIATGDCLHSGWLEEIKECEERNGIFEMDDASFVLSTEVEDSKRVHHLILFPSLSSVKDFKDGVGGRSPNIESDGRPNLRMDGSEIAQLAKDADALIGPAHAFTPWTALYAYHDSLNDCYKDMIDYVSFIELGLSADSGYADRIAELQDMTFLSNSDAHSPYPSRLGREFNRFELEEISWKELKKALSRRSRKVVLNVGLPPQEGKYNESACISCYRHYSLREAIARRWICHCGKKIKKGVRDRIEELATYEEPHHPIHRPPYMHLIPLAEIIATAIRSSPFTKVVMKRWEELVDAFGSEIRALIDVDIEDIATITPPVVANAIKDFRENKIIISPGGGGKYGEIKISEMEKEMEIPQEKQKSLLDF